MRKREDERERMRESETNLVHVAIESSLFHHRDDDTGVLHVAEQQILHAGAPAPTHGHYLSGAGHPVLAGCHLLEVLQDAAHLGGKQTPVRTTSQAAASGYLQVTFRL